MPHDLTELSKIIIEYLNSGNINYSELHPSFPSGGIIINKNDLENIYKTGKGKVVLRGKTDIQGNIINITEIPYQTYVEPLIDQIKKLIISEEIKGISNILNKSDKKHLLIEIECDGNPKYILSQLFQKTDLQKNYNANQYALVGKTPKLLSFKEYLDIYLQHNFNCIKRENEFELKKASDRFEIVNGLIKALEDIDNIILLIKKSDSSNDAIQKLIAKYEFTLNQAKAIVNMKLGSLARLEGVELNKEKEDLTNTINNCNNIIANTEKQKEIYIERFTAFVNKYKTIRRTELVQLDAPSKEEKEIAHVDPEKCVVIMTEDGYIKRIPATSFRAQKRNGKGIKTKGDITSAIIRTNTIDSLMVFTNKGRMYRILVDDIPVGSNTQKGASLSALIEMENGEIPTLIYSIYRDTDAQFILFTTQNGIVKKTPLSEYTATKRKSGIAALNLREGDQLAKVNLIKDEEVILLTEQGKAIRFKSSDISPSSRASIGIKGISLASDDKVVDTLVVRDTFDKLAVFSTVGSGKKIALTDLPCQGRAGKGLIVYKDSTVVGGALVQDEDMILVAGDKTSICILGKDIPLCGRAAMGNAMIKQSNIVSISKV